MSFDTVVRKLNDKLEKGDDRFLKNTLASEKDIFATIISAYKEFETKNGVIQPTSGNQATLTKINGDVSKAMKGSKLKSHTRKYLRDFNVVEDLSKQAIDFSTPDSIDALGLDVSTEKKLMVEDISMDLATTAGHKRLALPLRRLMYQHATGGVTLKEAESQIKEFILGDKETGAWLTRHARTLAQDALRQFNGRIQLKAIIEFGLTHILFTGSLIATSRQNCVDLIEGTGNLGEFVDTEGYIEIARIDELIAQADKSSGSGWNDAVKTWQDFIIHLNGFGCRHSVIATIKA